MNVVDLRAVLAAGGVEIIHQNSNGWLVCRCPFAAHLHERGTDNNPSCFVKIAPNGYSGYNCYSCHSKGRLSGMFERIAFLEQDKATTKKMRQVSALCEAKEVPDSFGEYEAEDWQEDVEMVERPLAIVEMYPLPSESKMCRAFLASRHIDVEVAELLGLRYDPEEKRLVFPVKDFAGRLFGFVGRDVTGRSEKKVKNYYGIRSERLLLGEDRLRLSIPTIVQEGPMGWLSLIANGAEKYANVVATFGSHLSNPQKNILTAHSNPIILLYDLDAAGDIGIYGKKVNEVKVLEGALEVLEKHLPTVVGIYPSDVDDVDKMREKHIAEIVNNAWKV